MDDLGGVTYNDLIRDVFGWSSRVPHQLINCYIRDGKLFVIQRGHESHTIDISDAKKTMPVITKELVRTTWGSTPWSKTETTEFQYTGWQAGIPDDVTISGSSDTQSGGSDTQSGGSDTQSGGEWTTDKETWELTTNGLSLYDSSFPIHDEATLIKVTKALKWLNRKTQETLNISLYEFPHLIDFDDRVVFNGNEYFLVNNTATTTPRIFNEQNLTLVRWY